MEDSNVVTVNIGVAHLDFIKKYIEKGFGTSKASVMKTALFFALYYNIPPKEYTGAKKNSTYSIKKIADHERLKVYKLSRSELCRSCLNSFKEIVYKKNPNLEKEYKVNSTMFTVNMPEKMLEQISKDCEELYLQRSPFLNNILKARYYLGIEDGELEEVLYNKEKKDGTKKTITINVSKDTKYYLDEEAKTKNQFNNNRSFIFRAAVKTHYKYKYKLLTQEKKEIDTQSLETNNTEDSGVRVLFKIDKNLEKKLRKGNSIISVAEGALTACIENSGYFKIKGLGEIGIVGEYDKPASYLTCLLSPQNFNKFKALKQELNSKELFLIKKN
jgi:hypothetical protein